MNSRRSPKPVCASRKNGQTSFLTKLSAKCAKSCRSEGLHSSHQTAGRGAARPASRQQRLMADQQVDLFVIGAGSGGVRAARVASRHGARVMIAEEYRVGGTCVIRGCVPKKLLVYASRLSDEFEDAEGYGWNVPEPTFHWPTLTANVAREVARLEAAYTTTLERLKVTLVKGRAVLEDAHTIRLADGARVCAETILIATGAWPHYGPKIPGLEHAISSNEAFHLRELPRRIVIQGGGYISVEFANIF